MKRILSIQIIKQGNILIDVTVTTVYIGSYYEQVTTVDESVSPATETTEWKKYYYAGTTRLYIREDTDNPLYLIGDHLGSTSLVIDIDRNIIAQRSYKPYGET